MKEYAVDAVVKFSFFISAKDMNEVYDKAEEVLNDTRFTIRNSAHTIYDDGYEIRSIEENYDYEEDI